MGYLKNFCDFLLSIFMIKALLEISEDLAEPLNVLNYFINWGHQSFLIVKNSGDYRVRGYEFEAYSHAY